MPADPPPNIHPTQLLTTPLGEQVEIDAEIADLIQRLWEMGLATSASCQDFGEATAGLRNTNPNPPEYGHEGFIEYYTGFAWLKMPTDDATRLLNALAATSFRERVSVRWRADSWRIHQ